MPTRSPKGPRSLPRTLAFVIGSAVTAVGISMVAAAAAAAAHLEWDTARGILIASVVTMGTGLALWRGFGRPAPIGVKEGFATVGLAWFVISIFGALPYLFTETLPTFTDAFFETASGFTTTGSSVIVDPAALPRGIGVWRAMTQWIGGMGVIVLSVAILPLLGTGGMQLARAESPGHTPDRLTPRFQDTAKRLWLLYVGFTAAQIVLLVAGEMGLYEAVTHSFSTLSTGGFGVEAGSVSGYSAYSQWVIALFMFIGGASFALHYRALRRPRLYAANAEFRLYASIILAAVVIVTGGLLADTTPADAIRHAVFNVISIITTTGFATDDFGVWRPALQILIVGLMFPGGMSGSTAGAVKTFRVGILSKAAFADLRRLVHPRGVFTIRFGSEQVDHPVVEAIQSFFLFYVFLFMSGTFLLMFIDANIAERLDLVTAASAVASSLGNVGPGLGLVGPMNNFAEVTVLGKVLLSSLMIVGRLEIFPVLLLFTRDLWRR